MARSRTTAKKAGSSFETLIASTLAELLDDDRIERRSRNGSKDRGDIAGVRTRGQRVVIECKNVGPDKDRKGEGKGINLPAWTREAQLEAGNDDALVGVVAHKRHGNGRGAEQWISMTVQDFAALLAGQPITIKEMS